VGEIEARVGEIMTAKRAPNSAAASKNVTKRIQELGDWRGETLAWVRQLIHDADPEIQEEWKWMGTPVWSHDGGVCTGESYKLRGRCAQKPHPAAQSRCKMQPWYSAR
jgi:hypothetical protein